MQTIAIFGGLAALLIFSLALAFLASRVFRFLAGPPPVTQMPKPIIVHLSMGDRLSRREERRRYEEARRAWDVWAEIEEMTA